MLITGGLLCCLLHLPYFQLRSLTATPAGRDHDDTRHNGDVEGSSLTAAAVASPGTVPSSSIDQQPLPLKPIDTAVVTAVEGGGGLIVSTSTRSMTEDAQAV